MNEIFAHTISRIDFVDGMVRIELANPAPGASDVTELEPKHILHMPLGGFMRGAVTLEGFIREMAKRGILPAPNAAAPATSPNFG
jgi:hypothetical protein